MFFGIPLVNPGKFCYNTPTDASRRNSMKKRLLCCLLAVVICAGSIIGLAPRSQAADAMTVSQKMIDMLKKVEGFAPRAYWDHSQWTVGYGTRCPNDMLDVYDASTGRDITEEEAETLLHEMLQDFEDEVNQYIDNYSLSLTQYEFDALVSFTYNCGGSWTYNDQSSLNRAIRAGLTGTDLVYTMSLYSMVDTSYDLINRRLSESYLYLEGQYEAYNDSSDGTYPYRYRYVFLDGNGGDMLYAIHGYTAADPTAPKAAFTRIPTGVDDEGNPFIYSFAGWYTSPTGGSKIEILDDSLTSGTILYAHWADPNGNIVQLPKGTAVDNVVVTVQSQVNVRSGPATFYSKTGKLYEGDTVTVTQVYTDDSLMWGQFDGGWVCLNYTDFSSSNIPVTPDITGISLVTQPEGATCVQGSVITDLQGSVLQLNYSDGTTGAMTLSADMLDDYDTETLGQITVTATYAGYSVTFPVEVVKATVTFIADGTVISQNQYAKGESVTVPADPTADDGAEFIGWTPDVTPCNGNRTYTAVFARDVEPDSGETDREPDSPEPSVPPAEEPQWPRTGIITGKEVNVRTGPGTQYDRADYQLNTGNLVVIHEVVYDGSTYNWGRMEDGHWVCMDYVKLLSTESTDLPGDITGDSIVNKDDAIYLLRHVVFPDKYPVSANADINADNTVNKDDAIYLLRHVVFPDKYPLIYG